MKGLIIVNAYIKNQSQISQAQRLAQELKKLNCKVDIEKNVNICSIEKGKIKYPKYDFCVYLDKDKACARMLKKSGIRLFNRAEAIEVCDNKMLTHIALADKGIEMPNSIYAPLCYYDGAEVLKEFIVGVERKLCYPLVAKKCYGSLGAEVYLIKNRAEFFEFESKNKLSEHFYQQFINCGRGEDIRVIVVGGKVVCAMKRINDNDFRSNIELGGRGEKIEPDTDLINLCQNVAKILRLDYCGIDVLTDPKGVRYVCEVNSNAFFAAAESVCGVNVANAYAQHIVSSVK